MVAQSESKVSRNDAIANLFWNSSEGRLRSGWRILLQVLLVTVPLSVAAVSGAYTTGDSTDTRVMMTALPVTVISLLLLGRWVAGGSSRTMACCWDRSGGGPTMERVSWPRSCRPPSWSEHWRRWGG